jgi:hypothetical protein
MNHLKINESLILLGCDNFSLHEQAPEIVMPFFFQGQVIALCIFLDCLPLKINKTLWSFDSTLNS